MSKIVYWALFGVMAVLSACSANMSGPPPQAGGPVSNLDAEPFYYYDRETKKPIWLSLDEIALFPDPSAGDRADFNRLAHSVHPRAAIEPMPSLVMVRMPEPMTRQALAEALRSLDGAEGIRRASPVFYQSRARVRSAWLIPTGNLIVQFPPDTAESRIAELEREFRLERLEAFSFAPNTFLEAATDALASIRAANLLQETGAAVFAHPDWLRAMATRPESR